MCTYILYRFPRLSVQRYFFPFLQRMDWKVYKMLPGWARRRRRAEGWGAFAELCSSVPGARRPCRRWSARGRYCRRRCRRRRRSMAAPAPRPLRVPSPPARVPGERWSGVGPVCLPPAPSPESRSLTERKGEGVSGGGGGLERPGGGAGGDCHPAICLGGGTGVHTAPSANPGRSPAGAQGGAAGKRPMTSPSTAPLGECRSIGRERALARGGRRTVRGRGSGTPRQPPRPSRSPAPSRPSSSSESESAAETVRPRGPPRAGRRFPGSTLPLSDTTGAVLGGAACRDAKCDRLS